MLNPNVIQRKCHSFLKYSTISPQTIFQHANSFFFIWDAFESFVWVVYFHKKIADRADIRELS